MKIVNLLLIFTTCIFAVENEYTIENSNFTLSLVPSGMSDRIIYNYDRLRVDYTLKENNWYFNFIGDIDNYYGSRYVKSDEYKFYRSISADTPFKIETPVQSYDGGELFGRIYRFNVGYNDEKQRIVFGLQNITTGVGRIWTPTDIFSSSDPLALEPDEIYGIYALSYTYSLGKTSEIMGVISQRRDKSYRYSGRIKGNFGFGDAALDLFGSNDAQMIGYELEGDLFDTGIEWRSEGGYFKDKISNKNFFQGILGIDYGFKNGVTAALEWLHTSKTYSLLEMENMQNSTLANNIFTSSDHIGTTLSYDFTLLLHGSAVAIYNPRDNSLFASPVFDYSLDDDTTISAGAMLYFGNSESEFGGIDHRYYLRLKKTF